MKKLQQHRPRFKGWTMGLDLHKQFFQYCWLDEQGDERANERGAATPAVLWSVIQDVLDQGRSVQVSLEASGCFLWAYDLLVEKLGADAVQVAAPSKVRVIADSQEKNDSNDAWWLAYLAYEGRLPRALVATGALRELRIACREQRSVIQEQSDLKRRLRSHLAQLGLPLCKTAWVSIKGRAQLDALLTQVEQTAGMRGQALRRLSQRIDHLQQEVRYWRQQSNALAQGFPLVELLETQLPGVGPTIAAVVVAELGDPRQYHSPAAYAKATGLTPGYRESAGRRKGRVITREGSAHVRWALTRAILGCRRCKEGPGRVVRQWIEKRCRRGKSLKSAMVAAARKLAEGIWRLVQWGEVFDLARAFGGGVSPGGVASGGGR